MTTATTTTTLPDTPEVAAVEFLVTFESIRDDVIDALSQDFNIESVDKFVSEATDENDVLSLRVNLDVTSRWASEDNQEDGAWEITRAIAVLYDKTNGIWYNDLWSPDFALTNSGTSYVCSGDFMTALADTRKSRSDWLNECT